MFKGKNSFESLSRCIKSINNQMYAIKRLMILVLPKPASVPFKTEQVETNENSRPIFSGCKIYLSDAFTEDESLHLKSLILSAHGTRLREFDRGVTHFVTKNNKLSLL